MLLGESVISHFIGGRPTGGEEGETIEVWDPLAGEVISEELVGSEAEVDAAVRSARQGQHEWWSMAPADRERVLRRVGHLLEENSDALARLERRNTGKTLADAEAEVLSAAEQFFFYSGYPTKQFGDQIPHRDPSLLCYTLIEPVGVVGAITPWNYPLVIAALKASAALASGCSVVLKPAPETPFTALEMARLATEAGLPPGALNVVLGDGRTGNALSRHPGVAKLSFTGSTGTGRAVLSALSGTGKPAVMELGGKSPNIVFEDVDLKGVVGPVLMGAVVNSGQECCAGARVLVHATVAEEFLGLAEERIKSYRVGDREGGIAEIGPLITEKHRERVAGFVNRAVADGARVRARGEAPEQGFFYPPTLISGVEPTMEIWSEEVFGPVVTVDTFETDDEALEKANATRYGLAAGVWTADIGRALRFSKGLESGIVWINSYMTGSPNAPFGGSKDSGFGRERGLAGPAEYTEMKVVYLKAPPAAEDE